VCRANPQGELVSLGVDTAHAVAATGKGTRIIAQADHDVIAGHTAEVHGAALEDYFAQ
jgi:hypothetical protein